MHVQLMYDSLVEIATSTVRHDNKFLAGAVIRRKLVFYYFHLLQDYALKSFSFAMDL